MPFKTNSKMFTSRLNTVVPYLVVMLLSLVIGWLLFGRNTPPESTNQFLTVAEVQAVGKLELVRMQLKDVIEHKVEHSSIIPDARLLMVISGEVAGCIDLQKINETDMVRTDSLLTILLPAPEICFTRVDTKKSQIFSVITIPVLDNESELVQTLYRKAENYFQNDALQQEIFKQTKTNATRVLKPLFEKISGRAVQLRFKTSTLMD